MYKSITKGLTLRLFPGKAKAARNQRLKYKFASWKFLQYGLMASFGWWLLSKEPWLFQPRQWYAGWPNHSASYEMYIYYTTAIGLYSFGCFSVFWEAEQTRLDLLVMLVHHFSTIFLLGMSYHYNLHRIGSVIVLLHDVADPFMELAKILLYSGYSSVNRVSSSWPMFALYHLPQYLSLRETTCSPL